MTDPRKHIVLIIDDEIQIRRLLRLTLEANEYTVFDAVSGQQGLIEAAARRPDVILLDLGLPDLDGITVLRRLREWSKVPVIILSVRNSEEMKIAALDCGADDYVTKPFSAGELLARLRVVQRRSLPKTTPLIFKTGSLEVDLVKRSVKVKGVTVKLTATEYALLHLFVENAGRVLTHRQIMTEVWGPRNVENTHYLRVYMKHLREKLEENSATPVLFMTESGVGYRLLEV